MTKVASINYVHKKGDSWTPKYALVCLYINSNKYGKSGIKFKSLFRAEFKYYLFKIKPFFNIINNINIRIKVFNHFFILVGEHYC